MKVQEFVDFSKVRNCSYKTVLVCKTYPKSKIRSKTKISKKIGNNIKQTNVGCPFKKLGAKNKIFGKLTSNS